MELLESKCIRANFSWRRDRQLGGFIYDDCENYIHSLSTHSNRPRLCIDWSITWQTKA